jgi:hypothetical protein
MEEDLMHSAGSRSVVLSLTILASPLSALCLGACAATDKDVYEARVSPSGYQPGRYGRYVNLAARHHSVRTGVIRDVRIYERSKVTYTLVRSANKCIRVLPSEVVWCEKGLCLESRDELYALARAPFDGNIDPVAPDWDRAVTPGPGIRPLEIPIEVPLCPAGEKPGGFHDHHMFYLDSKGGS